MDTKISTTKRSYDIIAGPNKDALFDACKYAYNKSAKISIDFAVVLGYTTPTDNPGCAYIPMSLTDIKISGIEHEDGSGESFNLRGYCKADPCFRREDNMHYKSYEFRAYYNSKSRKGRINLIEL